ncbi:hypothetical protein MRX96_029863 [Rhipicephalus microplus]
MGGAADEPREAGDVPFDDDEGPKSYGTRACLADDEVLGDAGSGDRGDLGTGESTGTPAGVGTPMCGVGVDVPPASRKGCTEGTGLAAGNGAGEPGTEAEPTDVDEPLEEMYSKADGSPIDTGEEAPDPAAGDDEGPHRRFGVRRRWASEASRSLGCR